MRRWRAALGSALIAAAVTAALGSEAAAISDGRPARWSDHPWFASIGDDECGGVLVAPDRVVTSAGCAEFAEGARVRVGTARRRAVGVALAPSLVVELAAGRRISCHEPWADTVCAPDLALVRLSAAVAGVTPPALARARAGWYGDVVGHGTVSADADQTARASLRSARMRVISDARCRARVRRVGRDDLADLSPADTFCARDARPPRNAGICVGDGGAPLVTRRHGRPLLLGIGSWAARCGAGDRPSVFTDLWRHRAFLLQPSPTWRPTVTGYNRISGSQVVGGTVTCSPARFTGRVDATIVWWVDELQPLRTLQRGPSPSYVLRESDRGGSITCWVIAVNAGGIARAVTDSQDVQIP